MGRPADGGDRVISVHDMLKDEMIPVPDPDASWKGSDTLLAAGEDDDLARAAGIS